MKKEQGAVFDRRVGAISNVSVAVYDHTTQELAQIYSNNEETPQANPFQTDSMGRWAFYVANGRYDIEFSGSTISTFKLDDVLIEESGAGTFLQLTDTPSSYTGQSGKMAAVKAGEDGLEFVSPGTPEAHASTHENGGGDEISVAGLGGVLWDPQIPIAHSTSHQDGGGDEISVQGLSGILADSQTPIAHSTSHQDGGSDEISVQGLSGTLADSQTPVAHKTSHQDGGSDEISVQGLSGQLGEKQDANKIQSHTVDEAAVGNDKMLVYKTSGDKFVYESKTTPGIHATSHQDGGGDEISVAGLSGVLGDKQNADKIQGHTIDEGAIGNDKILVYKTSGDKFIYEAKGTPSAHATSHQDGGGDEISVEALSGELADLQKVKDHTHQSSGSGVGGKLDHGLALDGLADDDHTQYLKADGTRNAGKIIITDGANHYLQVPQLTTAERDALSPVNGMIIYNSTTAQFERYQAGAWAAFGGGGGSGKRRIQIPAAAFETRAAAGWAEFLQMQGTNFDWGVLNFDKDTDEKAISPPFRFSNWNTGNITVRIGWKANATSGNVMWVVSFLGRDTTTPEVWDAAFTDNALPASTTSGTAEYLKETVWEGIPGGLANNDAVIMKITRDADHASDTLAVDAKLLYVEIEYIEA